MSGAPARNLRLQRGTQRPAKGQLGSWVEGWTRSGPGQQAGKLRGLVWFKQQTMILCVLKETEASTPKAGPTCGPSWAPAVDDPVC